MRRSSRGRWILGCCAAALMGDGWAFAQEEAVRRGADGSLVATGEAAEAAVRRAGLDRRTFSPTVTANSDFYLHINGPWLDATEIPADRAEYGIFGILDDQVKEQIKTIIETVSKTEGAAGSPAQQVGDLYRSYMDVARRNELGIKPLQTMLQKIANTQSNAELGKLMARTYRAGVTTPFAGYVYIDARNSSEHIVYLTQAGLTLPDRDYYLKDDEQYVRAREALKSYIVDMLRVVGNKEPEAAADRIIALEKQIAAGHWTKVENRDPVKSYNKRTTDELSQLLSHLPWSDFAKEAGIGEVQVAVVEQPSYFETLNQLLADTPLQTWKDYLTFHTVDAFADMLSEELEQRHFAFHETAIKGVAEQKLLWKRGVDSVEKLIGMPLGQLYVERHFSPEAKQRMVGLVDNLKQAFAQRLDRLEWMGEATKKQAHDKLSKFTTKIGYPDKWKDYSSVEIRPDDLVGNAQRVIDFEYRYNLDKLGKPIDRDEWGMTPQTINAYYNPLLNEIVFPAAILQPPFFDLKADDAVNYGSIGAVIGHEISHGFDDSGSQFDGDGNLRNWWTEEDRQEFEKRTKALVEQYNQYKPFDDMAVNGELTLGENIGDLAGLSTSYSAYQLSLDGRPAEVIDGLTGDQRFFSGWARSWRRKYREPELRRRLVIDPHSPSQYRAIGPVINMDAFHDAFDTKPGDPMYRAPEERVRIW